jgi:hypothetical protein
MRSAEEHTSGSLPAMIGNFRDHSALGINRAFPESVGGACACVASGAHHSDPRIALA